MEKAVAQRKVYTITFFVISYLIFCDNGGIASQTDFYFILDVK